MDNEALIKLSKFRNDFSAMMWRDPIGYDNVWMELELADLQIRKAIDKLAIVPREVEQCA